VSQPRTKEQRRSSNRQHISSHKTTIKRNQPLK
jgi:hypothetical protein